MTNLEHYDFCKPYIMDDEYILWEGAPEKGVSLTSRDIVLLPFSVIWLGFALFWEYLAVTTSRLPLMVVWGLPFIGVGLYTVRAVFADALSAGQDLLHHHQQKAHHPLGQQGQDLSGGRSAADGHPSAQKRHRNHPVFRD